MASNSNRIMSIYNSRKNIVDILENFQGYNLEDYKDFSIHEIDAMYSNKQLDMLVHHATEKKACYVKYLLKKQIRSNELEQIIDDLYVLEEVLTKNDVLIIVIDDEPNDSIITYLKYIYEKDGLFVVIHSMKRLQYNVLRHQLVSAMTILKDTEIAELKRKYNVSEEQLPEISRFDPQALAMSMRPKEIAKFVRKSNTAMTTDYYRICV